MTDRSNPLPGIPLVESPLFENLVGALPPDVAKIARRLHEDGFAVIDFPEPDFDRLAEDTIAQLAQEYDWAGWRAKKAGGGVGGMRIQDSPNALVQRIASNPRIIELLSLLYGRAAFPFQTLNFPVGTEQPFHALKRMMRRTWCVSSQCSRTSSTSNRLYICGKPRES